MDQLRMEVPYFQVPNDIFELGLTTHEICVYTYLARLGNYGGKAFPSYQTIADKTGMSKRKAMYCVKELTRRGLLYKEVRRTSRLENQTNVYRVQHNLSGLLTSAPHAPGHAQDAPNKELEEKEKENNNQAREEKRFIHEYGNSYLALYAELYKKYTGREHPRLKESQLSKVEKRIDEVAAKHYMSMREYVSILHGFFGEYVNGGKNDGNINVFIKRFESLVGLY